MGAFSPCHPIPLCGTRGDCPERGAEYGTGWDPCVSASCNTCYPRMPESLSFPSLMLLWVTFWGFCVTQDATLPSSPSSARVT